MRVVGAKLIIFTPHAQRERGKVIGRGVHIYIRLITWVSVEYDEIFHELRQYCHEPQASGNTKYE